MTAIGRWSCGTSSPYWIEMSWARAAYSAASAQRPAQNSTQARPQSARALRGSSRSRHSSYSRSSKARASFPLRGRREGVHDGQRRLPHQLLAADGAREVAGPRRKILGASASPANQPRMACTARALPSQHVVVELLGELERRTGMVEPWLEARRPREATVDVGLKRRLRGRLAQRLPRAAGRNDRSLSSSRGGQEPRRVRAGSRLGEEIGENRCGRASTRPQLCWARAAASARRCRSLVGVRRRQPERVLGELGRGDRRATAARQGRGVVEDAAISASGLSVESARWRARTSGSSTTTASRP